MLRFSSIKKIILRLLYSPEEACRKNGMIIGKNCSIGTWSIYPESYLIELGNHVQITSGVHIFTHGGGWILRQQIPNFDSFGKVKIGDNVYIGNNAMIMPGIIVGSNVVIAAGSVVTKNVPDNCVVAGNPAKVVRDIQSYIDKYKQYDINCKNLSDPDKKKLILNMTEDKFIKCHSWLTK
jgi:acetyltransferase-like isoleucine patch superfamily enzyme